MQRNKKENKNVSWTKKTKEIVNNIMNYVIGKGASDEIKKNQHSVTKALSLSADNLCLESIKNDLWQHILDRIKCFNRDELLFLAEFMRESFSARLYPVAFAGSVCNNK